MSTQKSLSPWHVKPLPLGEILAHGWLAKELRTFGDGLAGHLHDFWPYVNNSKWLHPQGSTKGQDYSALNEPLPYWFNGLVPLAYLLDDERLKKQVHDVAKRVLELQGGDGWLGPEPLHDTGRNYWGRTPFTLGLIQLVEVDKEWEQPCLKALRRYYSLMNKLLKDGGKCFLSGTEPQWGQLRVFDTIIPMQWLLENYPSEQDELLWDNMTMLDKMNPWPWNKWYSSPDYPKVMDDPYKRKEEEHMLLHGVNVGQGLKAPAVSWRMRKGKQQEDLDRAMDLVYTYHAAPSGTMLADEFQRNGTSMMGSELCMHMETAYSMSYAYQALGKNEYADKAELLTYNALPAAFTDAYWAHQYMTQPNQPWCKFSQIDRNDTEKKHFTTSHSGMATVFGLEPEYPCCTSNLPQGWPKFITNMWGSVNGGLAHMLLGPSTVKHRGVTITCETRYPFELDLLYRVEADRAFDLYVRVPDWHVSSKSSLEVSTSGQGIRHSSLTPEDGLCKVSLPRGASNVKVQLGAEVRVEKRRSGAVSIHHGALLYALEVSAKEETSLAHAHDDVTGPGIKGINPRVKDHFLSNTSSWNIAIDPSTIKHHTSSTVPSPVFENGWSGQYLSVKGAEIDWLLFMDVTPNVPPKEPKVTGSVKEYKLVPYGSAKLHMSELPVISV